MSDTTTPQNISDTAHWVAWYRVLESQRPDAWAKDSAGRKPERPWGGVCVFAREETN